MAESIIPLSTIAETTSENSSTRSDTTSLKSADEMIVMEAILQDFKSLPEVRNNGSWIESGAEILWIIVLGCVVVAFAWQWYREKETINPARTLTSRKK